MVCCDGKVSELLKACVYVLVRSIPLVRWSHVTCRRHPIKWTRRARWSHHRTLPVTASVTNARIIIIIIIKLATVFYVVIVVVVVVLLLL